MNGDDIDVDVTMAGGAGGDLLANRYRIVKQLGQGGMGSVWLAEDTQLDNKLFAIKMLPSILVSNKRAYAQLKSEALVAMKLTHPNIVTLRAFEENDGNPFLVMDYIEGQTLDNCLEEWGNLSASEAAALLKPIAEALDYAHSQGVVHRDVKPGNVMVRSDGVPFILDFGIAREVQESMTHITGRQSSGTLLYMSPEHLNGDAPRPAQDVYSFAAMAYECIKGAPPFSRGNVEYQIMNKAPEPLSEGGESQAPIVAGIMAGLSKNPGERPESCMSLLSGGGLSRPASEVALPSQPEVVPTVHSGGKSQKRWWSDIPKTPVAVILTVLLMLGVFLCRQFMSEDEAVSAPSAQVVAGGHRIDSEVQPPADAVTTNRVVRIVSEEIVRTNRVVHVVDNVVVTNYVVETLSGGEKPEAAKGAEKPWVPGPTQGLVLSPDGKTFLSAPKGLKSVAIPDGVTKIADRAFADQKELMYVSIPPSVAEIGKDVFKGCGKLSGIYISDLAAWCRLSFKRDEWWWLSGDYPLRRARNLFLDGVLVEDMEIPQGVASIGLNSLRGCDSIMRVTIPASVVIIENGAFTDCQNLSEIVVAENNQHYKSVDGLLLTKDGRTLVAVPAGRENVTIPNGVVVIGEKALLKCKRISKFDIPNGVTEIGIMAFSGCSSLKSISYPPSMAKIGHGVFEGCDNLADILITDIAAWCGLSSIAEHRGRPLEGGRKLYLNGVLVDELKIPDGVTRINDHVFCGCSSLTRVSIPRSVEFIGRGAFAYCKNLKWIEVAGGNLRYKSNDGILLSKDGKQLVAVPGGLDYVKIPNRVEVICGHSCAGCNEIDKIPEGVVSIDWRAFEGCKGLSKIELPISLKHIDWSAFASCNMLERIIMRGNVEKIDSTAFWGCSRLKEVIIKDGVQKIADCAFNETSITNVSIPGSVERIGGGAFRGSKLENLTLKNGVKDIGEEAFKDVHIKSLVIPESVTNIAARAFCNCKQLESVTVPEGLANIAENAFEGCDKLLDANGKPRLIRVPRGANKSAPSGNSNPAPTVKIVATVDGREVKGAKVRVGAKDHLVPITWNVKDGASYGPYDVSYENGGRRYRGTFGKVTVDWRGEKTIRVPLELRGSSK